MAAGGQRGLVPSWVDFLNEEASSLGHLEPPLPKIALRGHVRDRIGESFDFPLELELRGLVTSRRGDDLEVVPEGLTRDAAALAGPILVRSSRPLESGSVLKLRVRVMDPRRENPDVPGIRVEVLAMDVLVAVEP